ncbi:MAG: HNH endonuclease [Chloroflexi bacterium]|nr:HNH endonuclease [Chloroflexota bacterium]|tara:strand:- start:584 stop:1141 length:558 start_codon:yes stop_codon:yes gene_type:complete
MLDGAVLILNQNYEPLNVCNVRRALILMIRDKAQPIELSTEKINAVSESFAVPSVIRLLSMVRRPVLARKLSRKEVFWRDNFTCQYCGQKTYDLTLDHVVPRVLKGPHIWENVVAACVQCNHRKAGRTPLQAKMQLLSIPSTPKANPYDHLMHRVLPPEWNIYLPWLRKEPQSSPRGFNYYSAIA